MAGFTERTDVARRGVKCCEVDYVGVVTSIAVYILCFCLRASPHGTYRRGSTLRPQALSLDDFLGNPEHMLKVREVLLRDLHTELRPVQPRHHWGTFPLPSG